MSLFKEDFQTYQEPNDTQAILDNAGIPIRNFYFDSTPSNLERGLGIFVELAKSYQRNKPWRRELP